MTPAAPSGGDADVVVQVLGSALGAHPGSEVVGVVVKAGAKATEWLGRLVVVPRLLSCGECAHCLRGRLASCRALVRRGPPVPRTTVPSRYLLTLGPPLFTEVVPQDDAWRYAALADTLAAPHDGLVRAGVSAGDVCVVLGGSFRAAAAVWVARALGCEVIIASASEAARERLCAAPFSAHAAVDTTLDPQATRAAVTALLAAAELPTHGLFLIETTGTDAGRARALGMVGAGDTVILLDRQFGETAAASTDTGMAAPLPAGPQFSAVAAIDAVCNQQARIIGAPAAHPDLLIDLFTLVQRHRDQSPLEALSPTPIAADEIDGVLARRRRGEGDALVLPVVAY